MLVAIRAGGLAAECLLFQEDYGQRFKDPNVQYRIQTDISNAKDDLLRHKLIVSPNDPSFEGLWEMAYHDARIMLEEKRNTLTEIAEYCFANQGRDILRDELVANIGLL